MLAFHGNAIVLSGITGSRLKSKILGIYYRTWWEITSGGSNKPIRFQNSIVEMNAGTGEIYIEDSQETILGSSGHALQIKGKNPSASKLNVILVEEDDRCFARLQRVIKTRWAHIDYSLYPPDHDRDWVYLLRNSSEVLDLLDGYDIGNTLFFFDPLLFTPWADIEKVAQRRIKNYYQTGTEFLLFIFTSDWFTGRGDWHALPDTIDESKWNEGERLSVQRGDQLFGSAEWRDCLLDSKPVNEKIDIMVELYKTTLHKWFRFVLPLPFTPRNNQLYHIFICSNYAVGTTINRNVYAKFTENKSYQPNNRLTYKKFLEHHPEKKMHGSRRSTEWKVLWKVIKEHEDGICDVKCKTLTEIQSTLHLLNDALQWLKNKKYIKQIENFSNVWPYHPTLYALNWDVVKQSLNVEPSKKFKPLSLSHPIN